MHLTSRIMSPQATRCAKSRIGRNRTLLAVPEVSKVQENIDCSHSDPAASAASARSAVINDVESMRTTVPQSCLRLSNNSLLKKNINNMHAE